MEVFLEKINEVWCKVIAPSSILYSLSEKFTFEVPNAKFMKTYKSGKWDGKIRLLKRPQNKIYIGLAPVIEKFCKENNFTFGCDFSLKTNFNWSDEEFNHFMKVFLGELLLPYELRPYQRQIIQLGLQNNRAIFLSATSSGKSICIYALARFYEDDCDENEKILILVPTINLVEQLYQNFIEYSAKNKWNVEKYVQKIYHGQEKKPNKKIIISTWQSMYDKPHDYLTQFRMVIFDEVHTAKANEISKLLTKLDKASIRFGFSGTLNDDKLERYTIQGLFGPIFPIIDTNKLIETKYASPLEIKAIKLNHPPKKFKSYVDEIDYLITNKKRNNMICKLALQFPQNTLILVSRIKHGEELFQKISEKAGNRKVYFVYGKTPGDIREDIRQEVEQARNSIIIANIQLFAAGIDIKSLTNIILAHPTKSKIRILQSIGRILRLHPEKEKALFFDFGDNFKYSYEQFLQRLKLYTKEKFKIQMTELDLGE